MTPQYWQKVKIILEEVLEIAPERRDEYLTKACGQNRDLRREVNLLLEFEEENLDLLEDEMFSAVINAVVDHEPREETSKNLIGGKIGNYRIISELGAGGMGTVFLAERSDGAFEKKVALKLIKPGMASDAILRRFFMERSILAQLKHQNIAPLLDGGTTNEGLPYFVIEYVEGETITDYATRENLDLDDRLKLFQEVCAAVSFAHSTLIIHRDLKPSNILVSRDGHIKLLDFGIAKILKSETGDRTLATATQNFVFTPEYASPEQVRGEKLTTATDIYSLGVILYELLTGNRPFKNVGHGIGEIISAVCEAEPERPSSVVSVRTSSKTAEETKNTNSTGNPKPKIQNPKSLRGDLDNIILKSLRKEPEHRYRSVEQFSEDIGRYQAGLPVTASKGTWTYHTSKFIRRNRLAATAAGLVSVTLLGGLAATYYQVRIARAERAKSERRFNEVRQLARTVLFDYHDAIAGLPGSTAVRERIIKDSLQYLDNLAGEVGNDSVLQHEIAAAYLKIGDVQGGASTTSGGNTLSGSNLGDTQGAFESYSKALIINEQLILLEPNNQELAQELAKNYLRMAEINTTIGNLEATTDYYRRAITTFEKLFAAAPSDKPRRVWLAMLYFNLGKVLGVPGTPNLGRPQEALDYIGKAVEMDKSLLAEEPNNLSFRQALGTRYGDLGRIHYSGGNYPEALTYYRQALVNAEQIVREDPTNALYCRELAVVYRNFANTLLATGDKSGAIENLRLAIALFEDLMKADVKDTRIHRSAAYGYRDLGVALSAADQPGEALKNLNLALEIFTKISEQDLTNTIVKQQLAITRLRLSEFFMKNGDAASAAENARRSIAVSEVLIADGIQDIEVHKTLTAARNQFDKCLSPTAKNKN